MKDKKEKRAETILDTDKVKIQKFDLNNMSKEEAKDLITKEILNKNQLILIYCQYGGRSRNVCRLMRKIGYNNVYNLYGGLEML